MIRPLQQVRRFVGLMYCCDVAATSVYWGVGLGRTWLDDDEVLSIDVEDNRMETGSI